MRLAPLALILLALVGCRTTAPDERPPPPPRPTEPVPVDARLISVDDVEPDPAVVAMLAPFGEEVQARAKRVVGVLADPLERDRGESTMGSFVADAMLAGIAADTGRQVDICFTNNGGLRRDLPAGTITAGLVVELMPFDNGVVVFEVDRSGLEGLMDQIAKRGDPAAGVVYTRTPDRRASRIEVRGKPLRNKRYVVCTSDYLFEGGGGYAFDDAESSTYTGVLLRDLIMRAFEENEGPIKAPPMGRVRGAG
jgi:2',3'-cyclic-nucleotide 2'-phosphodiesterase (5'-nucleotidase family)